MGHGEVSNPSAPYGWAVVAGSAVFLLYVVTLAPTTAFWDASEYIASAHIAGIPHPPGNPLFVVLARAWTVLLEPTGLSVAVRVNLFSAFLSGVAHGSWFLVVHHVLLRFSPAHVVRLVGAGVAVLVSATAYTVWNQSNVNEKVYTVSLLTIALLSWLAILWRARLGQGREGNLLVLMVFILALSVGNHLMAFLAAPALGLFVVLAKPKTLLRWTLIPSLAAATLLGLSIHLFLPIRAEFDPLINEGAPECEGLTDAITSVLTYGGMGCEPLNDALRRRQYKVEGQPGPGLIGPRQAPLASQALNYLQYFDWQWARSIDPRNTVFSILRFPITLLFALLGFWGARKHFLREKASFWYFLVLFGTLSGALVYYLNFKYGYSFPVPRPDLVLREVRERDYFFLVSFSVWGLWAGMGIVSLWVDTARRFRTTLARTCPILALAIIPLVANWSWADRSYDHAARDWAHNLLMSVEPYGVLFTNGDNDTFPLWYLQEVEGIRRDVTVVVYTYLGSPWYARQVRDVTRTCSEGLSGAADRTRIICQREYTARNTDSIYVYDVDRAGTKVPLLLDRPIRVPARTALPLDDATIQQVAGNWVRMDGDRTVRLGEISTLLPAGKIIAPWMQFALALINESVGERPIYFSSNGGVAAELGLQGHLMRQGLAFKLMEGDVPVAWPSGSVRLAESPYSPLTGRWVHATRTRTLLDRVFEHHSGIPDRWGHWPDRPSVGVPNYYAWAYLSAALAAEQGGQRSEADRYLERSEAWAVLGS